MTYRTLGIALLCGVPTITSAQPASATRVCIAPATIESAPNAAEAMTAVRDAFSSVLTGPGIAPVLLQAKLPSLVRAEAKQSNCTYLLIPTFKHVHKSSGNGILGKAALGAVQSGAYQAGGAAGSAAGRVGESAANGAANQALWHYEYAIKTKDEVSLGYRLESATGQLLLDDKASRKAESDGEDVLTPLVQQAAEKVVTIITKPTR
jgi:hypothetical protein